MTYKQVVKNSVEMQIGRWMNAKTENRWADIVSVELSNEDLITFDIRAEVKPYEKAIFRNKFEIHGYVDDYGRAVVTFIRFERTTCKRLEDGSFTEPKTKIEWVHGEEIETFKFDR